MVNVKETLRGNERIQQLMEEFPEIHRTLVVKTDLIREGIKPNEATRQLGRWALPYAPWYFEYSREGLHSVEDKAEAYFREPLVGHFSNWVSWPFLWLSRSPYEVRYEGAGRYQLYRDGEAIEEAFFPPRPQWMDQKTSSGKPMSAIISQRGEAHLSLSALNYCEFFKDGNGCRYCNINPTESTRRDQGLERVMAKRDEDIYETFVAALREGCVRESITISGGSMLDVGKEADNYARILRVLKQAMKDVGRVTHISVAMQAAGREEHAMLKEAGVNSICHPLEVWDPRLFEIICPGKAKNVGRERWLECLLGAVEVHGKGNVSSSLVEGIELIHPDGFKTEDEAAASVLEGCKWMNEHGMISSALLFRPAPRTMFENLAPPRTEYFLRVELARFRLSLKYNLMMDLLMKTHSGRPTTNGFPGLGLDFPYVRPLETPAAGAAERAG